MASAPVQLDIPLLTNALKGCIPHPLQALVVCCFCYLLSAYFLVFYLINEILKMLFSKEEVRAETPLINVNLEFF